MTDTRDIKIQTLGDVVDLIHAQLGVKAWDPTEPVELTLKQLKRVIRDAEIPSGTRLANLRVLNHPIEVVVG